MSHSHWSAMPMFCTVCGRKYDWHCGYSWRNSRACSRECHEEWNWRDVLSIMGKPYTPQLSDKSPLSSDDIPLM